MPLTRVHGVGGRTAERTRSQANGLIPS